jgi:hypothetical protein
MGVQRKETVASGSDFTYRWYAFRLSSVIVIGGFMHGHNIIKSVGINYEA